MKNYEKYVDEIMNSDPERICDDFVIPRILNSSKCIGNCIACQMRQMIWLLEDYEEPEVDWSKVKVDTPILVRNSESKEWVARHFAKYENGAVYAWDVGRTLWTAHNNEVTLWDFAKLAESEEE